MNGPDPLQRHREAIQDARRYMAEIDGAIQSMVKRVGPVGWDAAGEAARLRDELKEVADRLKGRGEYAR